MGPNTWVELNSNNSKDQIVSVIDKSAFKKKTERKKETLTKRQAQISRRDDEIQHSILLNWLEKSQNYNKNNTTNN